jgi:hypothetical protein
MLSRLTGQARLCRARAELCQALAHHRHCPKSKRAEYEAMAQHWFALARSYKLAEDISGFLSWEAERLEPPSAFVDG